MSSFKLLIIICMDEIGRITKYLNIDSKCRDIISNRASSDYTCHNNCLFSETSWFKEIQCRWIQLLKWLWYCKFSEVAPWKYKSLSSCSKDFGLLFLRAGISQYNVRNELPKCYSWKKTIIHIPACTSRSALLPYGNSGISTRY